MYGRASLAFAEEHLRAGRDVVLLGNDFEYLVSEGSERELKRIAERHNCWVLTPHGYAHTFLSGAVGIVGTAGTAIQHVGCMLHGHGIGVSRIYAVGRRDMSDCIAGAETLRAFRSLAERRDTEIIVVLLKPTPAAQQRKLVREASATNKPVVAYVLGRNYVTRDDATPTVIWAESLEDVVIQVTQITKGAAVNRAVQWAAPHLDTLNCRVGARHRRYIRGFFSGGSCCDETVRLLRSMGLRVRSNPMTAARTFRELTDGPAHRCIDLGGGLLTHGRFHQPMVNLSVKSDCILGAVEEPRLILLLLDVFLGYGSHPNPAKHLVPAITMARKISSQEHREVLFITTVIGMDRDPQRIDVQSSALKNAGAILAPNVTQAAKFAGRIVQEDL